MAQYKNRTGILVARASADEAAFTALKNTIDEVNGRATRHTYCAGQICTCAEEAEAELEEASFTERERVGTIVNVISGGPLASSYNGDYVATFATLVRREDGWYLTAAHTDHRRSGKGATDRMEISITENTADAVAKRHLAAFTVRQPKVAAVAA